MDGEPAGTERSAVQLLDGALGRALGYGFSVELYKDEIQAYKGPAKFHTYKRGLSL